MRVGSLKDGTRRFEFVSRIVLESILGRPIREGYFALHHCDRPTCIRGAHLYEGTHLQNIQDRHTRGRSRGGRLSGEQHPNAKVTLADVIHMRSLREALSLAELARRFGISKTQVCRILNGTRWPAH
jgi:hypothetical protein